MIDPKELTDTELVESILEIESGLSDWEINKAEEWIKKLEAGGILDRWQRGKAEEIFKEKA